MATEIIAAIIFLNGKARGKSWGRRGGRRKGKGRKNRRGKNAVKDVRARLRF